MNWIKHHLPKLAPIALLLGIEIALFFTNYTPGTSLYGWDNILPELNFQVNFLRNISSVWQEYRGVGLLDGMSHGANLVHTLFLWGMSLAVPTNLLRYFFIFLMHFLGGLGVYLLLRDFLETSKQKSLIAFTGAIVYLFNAYTIQMFFTPLEAFAVHFASLPWLALTFSRYLNSGSQKDLLYFLLTTLLSTPQFFVTPLLLPVGMMLLALSLTHISHWKRTLLAFFGFCLFNAFWLLPAMYSIPLVGAVVKSAKINAMSSNEIFLKNQVFGDFPSVALMRSFALDYVDGAGGTGWMMDAWRNLLYSPVATALYGGFFVIVLVGIVGAMKKKNSFTTNRRKFIPFLLTFTACFLFLGNDIPLLRELNRIIRDSVPLFGEAFRFAFTKFSLLYAFSYSLLLCYGLHLLCTLCDRIGRRWNVAFLSIMLIAIAYVSWPSFTGQFIYKNLKISFPKEYHQLINFMSKQNASGRTALLPQPDFWNWKFYRFGYRGSGFLWYGLPQPTLDRAFDPWSAENENYYWELSKALYSKDTEALGRVFRKYDIHYIIIDENLLSTEHGLALYIDQAKELLSQNPSIRPLVSFGGLSVFERFNETADTFVSLKQNLPTAGPVYRWNDSDRAYGQLGDYISPSIPNEPTDIVYPFRTLFTKRAEEELEIHISDVGDALFIAPMVADATGSAAISKPDSLVYDSDVSLSLNPKEVKDCSQNKSIPIQAQTVNYRDSHALELSNYFSRSCLSFGMPELWHTDGYVVAVETRHLAGQPLRFAIINATAKHTEIETFLPTSPDWLTSYFILPPLASDGLNYDVYITNDATGRFESTNDIGRIRVYKIPYEKLMNISFPTNAPSFALPSTNDNLGYVSVSHPNPTYYEITINNGQVPDETTLVLSQSYNPGWKAYEVPSCQQSAVSPLRLSEASCQLKRALPFLFGKEIKDHVLVNNWSNGWRLQDRMLGSLEDGKYNSVSSDPPFVQSSQRTIVLFFLPQLLQWLGFALLPIPFLYILLKKKN